MLFFVTVKHNDDPVEYFAERLYHSMKGMGTDDAALVRIFVTRFNMINAIKIKFEEKYKKPLEDWIKVQNSIVDLFIVNLIFLALLKYLTVYRMTLLVLT